MKSRKRRWRLWVGGVFIIVATMWTCRGVLNRDDLAFLRPLASRRIELRDAPGGEARIFLVVVPARNKKLLVSLLRRELVQQRGFNETQPEVRFERPAPDLYFFDIYEEPLGGAENPEYHLTLAKGDCLGTIVRRKDWLERVSWSLRHWLHLA